MPNMISEPWIDSMGHILHSIEEIEWMEAIDAQDREDDLKRWATQTALRDMLVPVVGISIDGKQLFKNKFTNEICYQDGTQVE